MYLLDRESEHKWESSTERGRGMLSTEQEAWGWYQDLSLRHVRNPLSPPAPQEYDFWTGNSDLKTII